MPTKLDEMVLKLRKARVELDSCITDFNKTQAVLFSRLEVEIFNRSTPKDLAYRLAKYRENIDTINRAKLDKNFQQYQQLKARYEADIVTGQQTLTEDELDTYIKLVDDFSFYELAIEDLDVLLVRRDCAHEIADIEKCAQKMMESVARYEAFRTDIVVILQKQMNLNSKAVIKLESMLNLYATVDYESLAAFKFELLLSERLEAVREMKESGFAGECSFVNLLKVDCMHIMYSYCLMKYAGVEAGALTIVKIRIYQCQDTDITKVQSVCTLKDTNKLINNAVINYVLAENLAAIKDQAVDASTIREKINQETIRLLVDGFDIEESKLDEMYGFLVEKSDDRQLAAIKRKFFRIQKIGRRGQLQYLPKIYVLYSEDKSGVVGWTVKEEEKLNIGLLESEML